jgi:ATP-dependent Zn protease
MGKEKKDKPGLSWPDHDTGPVPPPEYVSRERDEDRATRKPLAFWDRIKIALLLTLAFVVLTWNQIAVLGDIITIAEAIRLTVQSYGWILILLGLEVIRQAHFFVSEKSAAYHRFWTERFFGGFDRRTSRMNDWNRYRVARVLKLLFFLFIVDVIVAAIIGKHPAVALFELPVLLWQAMPFVLQLAFGFFFVILQFVGLFWFLSRGGVDVYMPDDIKTRFSDVWGQDHVLNRIKENMIFLEDPETIEKKGGYVPGGILLWGPPGTGKTLMAESVAGETGKPFVFVDPGAFINMFMGVGILKVKSLFRKLRKLAVRYGGVIVFFDEADSLGNRGVTPGGQIMSDHLTSLTSTCNGLSYLSTESASLIFHEHLATGTDPVGPVRHPIIMGGLGGGGMGTLNALLTELSGLKKPRGFFNRVVRRMFGMRPKPPPKYRMLVMMATNMPSSLDAALLRPGRIDRIYRVGYPSKEGRKMTYEGYLSKVKHELTDDDIEKIATVTPYATGASIKDLVNEALIVAISEGREAITWRDIVKAKLLKSLGPPEDVEYIERERHAVAIHEACHAVAAYRAQRGLAIDIATIEKGQSYLGMVSQIPLEEQFTQWRTEYEADIVVSLASLAGETLFFEDDNSSGVSGDLANSTSVAMRMEAFWGMGSTIGSHAATKAPMGQVVNDGTDRNMLETQLGARVEARLQELYRRAQDLVKENRAEILAVAHALETHKTLTGDDVEAIIEGKEGPLIDGRPYATKDFNKLAEAYHKAALTAHKSKQKPLIPLPVMAGVAPSTIAVAPHSEHPDQTKGP